MLTFYVISALGMLFLFGLPCCWASSETPLLIASAPMEVALSVKKIHLIEQQLFAQEKYLQEKYSKRTDSTSAYDTQWPPQNLLLRVQAARTRRMLQCRDTDIIIVSFPKSGTHWLASMISEIFFPGYSTNGSPWWNHLRTALPPNVFFHDFPVLWLLPEGPADVSGHITDEEFTLINEVPNNITRIFLSHMPTFHFEFEPSKNTKIVYLVREPHALWRSMLKFSERVRVVMNEHLIEHGAKIEDLYNETICPLNHTYNFMEGRLSYPPRLAENGPKFAWATHVTQWWREISSPKKYAQTKGDRIVVDFTQAMDAKEATVGKLINFFDRKNLNLADTQINEIVKLGSYERQRKLHSTSKRDDVAKRKRELKMHFPEQSQSTGKQKLTWAEQFNSLPDDLQKIFNEYVESGCRYLCN